MPRYSGIRGWALLLVCMILLSLCCTPAETGAVADAQPTVQKTLPPDTALQATAVPQLPTSAPTAAPTPEPTAAPTPEPTAAESPETTKEPKEAAATVNPQLTQEPEPAVFRVPEASGTLLKECRKAQIDYSHTDDGYVMVRRLDETDRKFKVQITKGGVTYTYDLFFGEWTTFPLSEGSGRYGVSVYENAGGSRYATVVGISFDVSLIDEFAPFLIPNTYVDYQNAANTIQTSEELAGQLTDALAKVDAIYSYMIQNVSYDYVQAATVKSGYIPDLDRVLKRKRGICFDYASLMTAMLRLRGVPCKLVFGYVGKAYHAWIRVWSDEEGWVDAVYFDGASWVRMDPTFAAAGKSEANIERFIGNGSNYAEKYFY